MKILKEFKEFAVRGSVIDLAVGVIIGSTFGKIVSSLVGDIIMPFIGVIIGGIDFTQLKIQIYNPIGNDQGVYLFYGNFIQSVIDFLIIAFVIFMMVKVVNNVRNKFSYTEEPPAEITNTEILLTEIRDLLKEKNK